MNPEKEQLISMVRDLYEMKSDDPEISSIQQDIAVLLGFVDRGFIGKILISGMQPGTGSTTTKDLLNRVFGLRAFKDAGVYRRAISKMWDIYLTQELKSIDKTQHEIWNEFESIFLSFPEAAISLLPMYVNFEELDDSYLSSFNKAQEMYATEESAKKWERLPDEIVWDELIANETGIWQGKLTAVIDVILEENITHLAGPIVRILLQIDPAKADFRVAQREFHTSEPTADQIKVAHQSNEARKTRDRENFEKTYGIDLSVFDRDDILHIDTTNKKPYEVAADIILHYLTAQTQTRIRE